MSACREPSPSQAFAEEGRSLRIMQILDAAGAAFDGPPAWKSVEIVVLECARRSLIGPERAARETLAVYGECVREPTDWEEEAERRLPAAALCEPLRWEI